MRIRHINFDGSLKLTIDKKEYNFDSKKIMMSDHVFNNVGSKLEIFKVFPKNYSHDDLMTKIFKLEKYSVVILKISGFICFKGFLKSQFNATFNPFKPKYLDIIAVSQKEFLTHKPMNFPIINKTYREIIELLIENLGYDFFYFYHLNFKNHNKRVAFYDTKNKNAYDILRFIEKHSGSVLIIKLNYQGKLSIEFHTIKSFKTNNRSTPNIYFDTLQNQKNFWEMNKILDFKWSANNQKDANFVIVDSEKVVSTLSRKIQIYLKTSPENVDLGFPIGKIDALLTKILKDDKNSERRVSIFSTKSKKPGDIIFTVGSNSIILNPTILGKDRILEIVYFPIIRTSIAHQDLSNQAEIAKISGTDGKLFRYEKHNDLSNSKDLFEIGQKYLRDGIEKKDVLTISSSKPIWDIGDYVLFFGGKETNTENLYANFIVREATIELSGVYQYKNLVHKIFTYKLVESFDLENAWNYYDSLSYRDNPIFPDKDYSAEISKNYNAELYIIFQKWKVDCKAKEDSAQIFENKWEV